MIDQILVSPNGKPSYKILISKDLDYSCLIPYVQDKQVFIVTNQTIAPLYLCKLEKALDATVHTLKHYILPDGEVYKRYESLQHIYTALIEYHYARQCVVIALGGGVIGDIAGFAAATYQRGVDLIHIPTSLLAQVDASIGGKTAINHPLGKNMIGCFYQPQLVYTATDFLTTLPQREFISALGEVVKYACIDNSNFFDFLETNVMHILAQNPDVLTQVIKQSCTIKARIVAQDELETNDMRALLNFGHTFAHAIECCQQYNGLSHGEAVGVGIAMATRLSHDLGYIDQTIVDRVITLLQNLQISTELPKGVDRDDLIAAMLRDKKNSVDNITFILLNDLGHAKVDRSVSISTLTSFFSRYF